jgi:hypothetical protein
MGAGFRRVIRRVLFATGMLLVGIALSAMLANQFLVVHLSQSGARAERRVYFECGVVRYVSMGSASQLLLPGLPPTTPAARSGRGSSAPAVAPTIWRTTFVQRFSSRDAGFGPYEWLPRHSDDGSAWMVSVPWWTLGAAGGVLMCAGFWGIRAPQGHCRKCEYDLVGLPVGASVCPECGAKLPAASAPLAATPCASSTSAHA